MFPGQPRVPPVYPPGKTYPEHLTREVSRRATHYMAGERELWVSLLWLLPDHISMAGDGWMDSIFRIKVEQFQKKIASFQCFESTATLHFIPLLLFSDSQSL